MLSSLQIENVAVIQKAEVHFKPGLNVLTGETGAGKSILIDSINAILGNRTSKDLVRTGASKAVIRAAFEEVPGTVLDSLEKAGYERSDALMLSREITAEGKSTCRINGMPATAAVLRELCGGLININGQHDSVGLLNPARHLGILDDYAQNSAEFQDYYVLYRELVRIKRELDAMITDEAEKQRKIDLLSYQVQEIEDAGLTAGEEQTLESRRKILANASAIRDKIAQSYALLSGDDEASGAVDLLGEASNAVDAAAQLDDALAGASSQLLDLYYNAKDVAADLIGRLDSYDTNDAELDEIEQRLDLIYKLKRKYGDTVEDVIAFGQNAREELERIQSSQERHDHLQAEKLRLYALAREKAEALTQTRLRAFEELNKRISGTLDFLNMPDWLKLEMVQSVGAKILHVVIWLVVSWILLKLLCQVLRKITALKMSPQASRLTVKIVKEAGYIIIGVEAFALMGVDILTLLGAASIIGVAVGFASQTSLSNIISGLFLVGEKQINLGDMIEVGGITGNVDSINLMSVQLRLPNNTMVRIPNEMIIKNPVSNITRFSTRRCDLDLGVDYNCDIEHVVSILQEVVKQNKLCLDDPAPVIMFTGFQDSSLGFKIGAWCLKDNFLDCQKTLAHDIKHRFAAEGISFPFPTRSLESRSPIQVEISGTAEKNQ